MKTKKLLILGKTIQAISLALMLVSITSCTMEKRAYMSGYHIEWNKSNKNLDQQKIVNHNDKKKIEINEISTDEQLKNETKPADNSQTIMASTNSHGIILLQKEKINWVPIKEVKRTVIKQTSKSAFKSKFKKRLKMFVPAADEPKTNGLAIASMVLGILALITYFGAFLFGLLAIIFGAIALHKISSNPEKYKGRGMALTGLICGIVSIALVIILLALLV